MRKEGMPFFHGVTDQMDESGDGGRAMPEKNEKKAEMKGDGLHHHEIHEDEGGGFHSKHTFPDGRVEHADHSTYAEARDHMDEMHGEEKGEDAGEDGADDFSSGGEADGDADDMAGDYGRAACR
jgi:hypothetical protein